MLARLKRLEEEAKANTTVDDEFARRDTSNKRARIATDRAHKGDDDNPSEAAVSHGKRAAAKRGKKPAAPRQRKTTKTTPALEKVTEHEIDYIMEAVQSSVEALVVVCLSEWARIHEGERCPRKYLASVVGLVAILPDMTPSIIAETSALLSKTYGGALACWVEYDHIGRHLGVAVEDEIDHPTKKRKAVLNSLLDVHLKFMALPRETRGRHPLAPLVMFYWQQIVTESIPFRPQQRASLPRLSQMSKDETILRSFRSDSGAPPLPNEQSQRPRSNGTTKCLIWILWVFDQAGGQSLSNRGGAPWDLRLWVFVLLHLRVKDRDGRWHRLRFSTEEVIGWLYPGGWANRRRDWQKLPDALKAMRRLAYVPVPGRGHVAMLFPSVIPLLPSDPLIEFTIRIPISAAHGDRIVWPRLITYGARSAQLFRAYLSVMAWLGNSSHDGYPLTRWIAAPLYGPGGKLLYRKDGSIARSDTIRIPNKLIQFVPKLTEDDLTRMVGLDPLDRRRRHDARKAFEHLRDDGVIDLQRIRNNGDTCFAIFGPSRDQLLTRDGAAAAAELLLRTARNLTDPLTRATLAKLAARSAGPERRALVHALRDVPRDAPLSSATLTAAACKLKALSLIKQGQAWAFPVSSADG